MTYQLIAVVVAFLAGIPVGMKIQSLRAKAAVELRKVADKVAP